MLDFPEDFSSSFRAEHITAQDFFNEKKNYFVKENLSMYNGII